MVASFNNLKTLAIVAFTLALCVQVTLGSITCENLNKDSCAFAISSTGKRCVLEKSLRRSGEQVYTCRTSEIEADNKLKNRIETDNCIQSCGVNRNTLGISSDSLLECHFTKKLCSPECYKHCPNIVDLYFNLAAGEGVYLPRLCEEQGGNGRRGMAEIRSSGIVAPAPEMGVQPANFMISPAMSPL
ncbi:hypothetical protein KY290_000470 [Solanum tuberosum]|uniref:PAR1 protein n=1 Tax=Solanum tuberosum TaxID=4113 RepID=A0ABQ7WLP5_SOLTU|nr:hypothetical protein KY284_000529 [Solanum tuberosum]KAH0729326.1 hypothetical protein KY289_000514 [Solanum tuberosum]KAH0780872.1 hypothetical protein KY290_000470 [Solanum tuberosum]